MTHLSSAQQQSGKLPATVSVPGGGTAEPANHSVARVDQRHVEMAIFDALRKAPNAVPPAIAMLVIHVYLARGKVSDAALIAWAATLLLGLVFRQYLVLQFRKLSPSEVETRRNFWVLVAKYITIPMGVSYTSYLLFAFPVLSELERLCASVNGATLVIGAVGPLAVVGAPYLIVVMGGLIFSWAMYGKDLAWVVTLLSVGGLLNYLPYVAKVRASQAERAALVEHTQQLADSLADRNRLLEESARHMSMLIASASHDLRQPVHALSLLLENLDRDGSEINWQQKARLARVSVDLLADMLRSLLDLSQLDTGHYKTQVETFRLEPLLQQTRDSFQPAANKKGLELRLDVRLPEGTSLITDRGLFSRMVANLVDNGIKYTSSGYVSLQAYQTETGAVRVAVADTGVGIRSDDMVDAFRAYVRLDNAGMNKAPGLGIGLAIVRRGADLLGLRLNLQSEPGKGTNFNLEAPVHAVTFSEERAPSETETPATPVFHEFRLLMIEDDDVIRVAMVDLLKSWGITVSAANGMDLCMAALRNGYRPDVILTDFQLDGHHNGLDCIRAVRQYLGSTQLPAVILTGDQRLTEGHLIADPGVTILHKPLRSRQLRQTLKDLRHS